MQPAASRSTREPAAARCYTHASPRHGHTSRCHEHTSSCQASGAVCRRRLHLAPSILHRVRPPPRFAAGGFTLLRAHFTSSGARRTLSRAHFIVSGPRCGLQAETAPCSEHTSPRQVPAAVCRRRLHLAPSTLHCVSSPLHSAATHFTLSGAHFVSSGGRCSLRGRPSTSSGPHAGRAIAPSLRSG
jgi:hypothetical protein